MCFYPFFLFSSLPFYFLREISLWFFFLQSLSFSYASFYLARFLFFFLFPVRLPENKQLANAHSATQNDPTCTSNFASNALLPEQTHEGNLGEMFVTLKSKFKFALSYWVDRSTVFHVTLYSKGILCFMTQQLLWQKKLIMELSICQIQELLHLEAYNYSIHWLTDYLKWNIKHLFVAV